MKSLVFTIVLGLLSFFATAQNFNREKLDAFFDVIEQNQKAMGSFSISKQGKVIYSKSIGYLDLKKKIEANSETVYRIGSISKTFTATIIMQLVEEGKLKLTDKLSSFFKDIPNATDITIEHLLRHRSGIFNVTSQKDYLSWCVNPIAEKEMLSKIASNEASFKPDEKAAYSNSNYILLAYIAEEIEGQSFADILSKRITEPLQLHHTFYGGKIHSSKNEALSYRKSGKWELFFETDMSVPSGAGAIVSTPIELTQFYNALFKGQLVSLQSVDQMKKLVDGFGIGLFKIPFYDKIGFGHNGGIDGFQSNAVYFPTEHVAVAYTSNAVDMPMNDILIGALSIYFGREYELPSFSKTIELTSKELDQYLGVYKSEKFPLDITITKKGNNLIGQATGQPSFTLECYKKHHFRFNQADLKLTFKPSEQKLFMKQRGIEFEFNKQ